MTSNPWKPSSQRVSFFGSVLILFLLAFAPSSALATEETTFLSPEGAQALYQWFLDFALDSGVARQETIDMEGGTAQAVVVFKGAGPKPAAVTLRPSDGLTDPSDPDFERGGTRFILEDFPPDWGAKLRAYADRSPPPMVWRSHPVLEPCPPPKPIPNPWSYLGTPLALLPLFWLLFLIWRWKKEAPPSPLDSGFCIGLGIALLLGIFLRLSSFSEQILFDMDGERDWAAALLFAQGIEAPWRGPAIYSSGFFLGPLYQTLMGMVALMGQTPESFLYFILVFDLLTLVVGAAFLRKIGGRFPALIFALAWAALRFSLIHGAWVLHIMLGFPFVALAYWAAWEMRDQQNARRLPVLALSLGLAIQFYAIHAIHLPLMLGFLFWIRLRPTRSQILQSLAALALTQAVSIGLVIHDLLHYDSGPAIPRVHVAPWSSSNDFILSYLTQLGSHPVPAIPMLFLFFFGFLFFLGSIHRATPSRSSAGCLLLSGWLLPFGLTLFLWNYMLDRYMAVFLPIFPMICAIGWGWLFSQLLGKWSQFRSLLGGFLLLGMSAWGLVTPFNVAKKDFDLRDQYVMADSLKRMGVAGSEKLARVHGSRMHSGWMGLAVLGATSPETLGDLGNQSVWLTDALPARLGTSESWGTLVRYEPQIGPEPDSLLAGPLALQNLGSPSLPWPVRTNPDYRSTQLIQGEAGLSSSLRLLPILPDPNLGSRIRLEWNATRLSRPVHLIFGGANPWTLSDERGEMLPITEELETEPTKSLRHLVFHPKSGTRSLILEIDLTTGTLSDLDLFDVPVLPEAAAGYPAEF